MNDAAHAVFSGVDVWERRKFCLRPTRVEMIRADSGSGHPDKRQRQKLIAATEAEAEEKDEASKQATRPTITNNNMRPLAGAFFATTLVQYPHAKQQPAVHRVSSSRGRQRPQIGCMQQKKSSRPQRFQARKSKPNIHMASWLGTLQPIHNR